MQLRVGYRKVATGYSVVYTKEGRSLFKTHVPAENLRDLETVLRYKIPEKELFLYDLDAPQKDSMR